MASAELTDKEAEIYDRQIRLWGVEGQRKLRAAKVLIAGCGPLGVEIAKNVILAGINVVLQDDKLVEADDVAGQFFLSHDDVGRNRATASKPRAQELNTLVEIAAIDQPLTSIQDSEWASYKLVILTDSPPRSAVGLADKLHALGVPVIAAYMSGYWAGCFFDFLNHTYTVAATETKPASTHTIEYVNHSSALLASPLKLGVRNPAPYTTFASVVRAMASVEGTVEDLRSQTVINAAIAEGQSLAAENTSKALDTSSIQSFVTYYNVQLAPVAAIVGGIIGNEVVKLMTEKDEPICNVFVYDAMGFTGGSVFKAVPS